MLIHVVKLDRVLEESKFLMNSADDGTEEAVFIELLNKQDQHEDRYETFSILDLCVYLIR